MKNHINKTAAQRGQTYPIVLVMCAVLSIMAFSLLVVLKQGSKNLAVFGSVMREQELAAIALEHALFKLQSGANWYNMPLTGFNYDREYTNGNGNYTVGIIKGNLFLTDSTTPSTRQGQDDYRTIGIKVKSDRTKMTHQYYAVVKKGGYAGALISSGAINLPCTANAINNYDIVAFWGDIYSANPADGMCSYPNCAVGGGNVSPQYWRPEVYAKGNIYTALSSSGCNSQSGCSSGGSCSTLHFGYTYDDLSPTAHCHPYSTFAQAPDISLDIYRYQAFKKNAYYGPATVGGNTNPYYIAANTMAKVTQANLLNVFINNLNSSDDVLFIDTTDGLPVSTTNTYTGVTYVTASTIRIYGSSTNEYYTRGSMFVMGPLVIEGDNPDTTTPTVSNASRITNILPPNNYYYPQTSDNCYYTYTAGTPASCYLNYVKHAGFIYCGGTLQIGGLASGNSNVIIYGSIYIGGPYGSITATTSPDEAALFLYYNTSQNMFGYMGTGVTVMSFNEVSFLVPTPVPVYPTSF
jgi:hypothetical protein